MMAALPHGNGSLSPDVREKLEGCIMQILERRRTSGLESRQIALRLQAYGFTIAAVRINTILQEMWERGLLLKERRGGEWRPPLRWKIAGVSITLEIQVSAYSE